MAENVKDLIGGAVLALTGAFFLVGSFDYEIGSARQMGPGYFPMVLSAIMIVVGGLIALPALVRPGTLPRLIAHRESRPESRFRPLLAVVTGIVAFGVAMESFGLLPAASLLVVISALGDRTGGWLSVVLLAIVIPMGLWIIFVMGLGLPLPAFKGLN